MRISDWSSDVCSSDLEGNKWGFFPSAAFAWRVVSEDFMRNIDQLSDLKLRLSWGKTGNQAIAPYESLQIGRASCRERVCQYVSISEVAVSLKKNNLQDHRTTSVKKA